MADVKIRLSVEGVGQVVSGVKSADQAIGELGGAARRATDEGVQGFDKLGAAIGRMAGSLAAIGLAGLGVRQFAELADAVTTLRARLELATGSSAAAAARLADLRAIADRMQQPLQEVAGVYLGISRAAADLGARQSELVRFTDGVAASLRLSGSSGAAASGALLQLAQMMGGTNVQAQEFNSLVDGAPVLLRTVAAHLGKTGVSMGELRQRVLDGKLTTQEFFRAFLAGADDLAAKAEAMPSTIGGAFTVLRNAQSDLIGRIDEQYQVTHKLSGAVVYLAAHLGQAKAVVEISALALLAYYKQAVVIPAVLKLWEVSKTALIAALARFRIAAAVSGSALGTLRTELIAANAATLTLTGGVSTLRAAFGALGMAFVGWEIGTILRENFLEAQLAGIAFVAGTLKGWEAVKYGAQVAWAVIGSAWREAVAGMGEGLAAFVGKIADGMAALGADRMAEGLRTVAQVVLGETKNTHTLADELAALKTGYDNATAAIGAITDEMADEAIAAFGSARAHAAVADAAAATAGRKKELSEAQKGYLDGLVKEHEKLIETRIELTAGHEAMERYRAAHLGVAAAADKLISANEALRKGNQAIVEQAKAVAQAQEDEYKARLKSAEAAQSYADGIAKQLASQQDENDALRLTAAGLAALKKARLADEIAVYAQIVARDELLDACTAETKAHKETRMNARVRRRAAVRMMGL